MDRFFKVSILSLMSSINFIYVSKFFCVPVWEKAIPVTSGWNYIDSENTIWYMFDVPGEGRYMVIIKSVYGKKVKIEEVRLMDPALHIAKAEIIAGRGKENNVIYCIDDNRLYRYSVTEGSETSLTFDELPVETLPTCRTFFMAKSLISLSSVSKTETNILWRCMGLRAVSLPALLFIPLREQAR